ncbi:NAD(P)/FAD-dependent oxidoreductase [Sulfurospirillum sp. 1612]|uniref:NAD(P)/FAD-dependent oxidoreductase n=1 Tax=Sulfurospirillum sp. 1612 TaxID=3094835 RepID=UPI002F93C113
MRDVIIVGGGVAGLMCAYALHKKGRKVTIIDKGNITDATSFGNAGILSPFDENPLSRPGILRDTLALMLKGQSPLKIYPTMDIMIHRWLLKFLMNATQQRVKKTHALFERYGHLTLSLYQQMLKESGMDFDFHQNGLMMLYTQEASFEKQIKQAKNRSTCEILDKSETQKLVPFANNDIQGSVLLKRNAHLDPGLMMRTLHHYLEDSGVEFILEEEVIDFKLRFDAVEKIMTTKNSYQADTIIFATGAHTAIARKTGTELMLTPAKGYSITFEMDAALKPKVPIIFADQFIGCAPRREDMRITGKLEIANKNRFVEREKIDTIIKNFKKYSIDFEMKNQKHWAGFRPLTPNDMPLIGRDETYKNLIYATGLGWLGVTFGPAIGEIISEMVVRNQTNQENTDILLFSGFYQGS